MKYDIFRHRHNFAVWAAARAAQRGLTSVGKLRNALERSGVVEFVRDHACSEIDASSFEKLHAAWCTKIIEVLKNSGLSNATFGRAAKLVAVYLKAMVVVGPHGKRTWLVWHTLLSIGRSSANWPGWTGCLMTRNEP